MNVDLAKQWFSLERGSRQRYNLTVTMPDKLPSDPVIEAYKQFGDREAMRANLRLSVEERIEKAMEMNRRAEDARRSEMNATRQQ